MARHDTLSHTAPTIFVVFASASKSLRTSAMLTIHVSIRVKPDDVDAFIAATIANASGSLQEPGVIRFDVLRNESEPTEFMLVEEYRTDEDVAHHKATAHYARWRDTVEPMMAEPRRGVRCRQIFPEE